MIKQKIEILILLFFILIQGILAQQRYCHGSYCMTIDIPEVSSVNATFTLEAPSTVGWLGFGIGSSMLNSYLVMAWPRTDGSIAISQRRAKGYSVPIVTDQQSDLILDPTSGIQTNTSKLVITFRRSLLINGSSINSKSSDFIWAIHTSSRPPDDPYTMQIREHEKCGPVFVPGSKVDVFIIVHGVIMFLAFGVALPLGIFFARFARNILPSNWFGLHWGIQTFATLPLAVAGIFVIFLSGISFEIREEHHVIGAVVMACLLIQLIIGIVHHKLYSPQRKYIPWWTKLHWWFGRLLALLAFVQMPLGLLIFHVSLGLYIAYGVYAASIIFIYLVLSFLFWKKRNTQIKRYGRSDLLYTGVRQQDDYEDELDNQSVTARKGQVSLEKREDKNITM